MRFGMTLNGCVRAAAHDGECLAAPLDESLTTAEHQHMNNNIRKQPTSSSQSRKMRLYGQVNSPEAYALRDFLNRSVVEFDWVELTCDADCHNELGLPSLEN